MEFVRIELDLAKTFCDAAFAADDEEKTRRNFEYARRALGSANKFAEQIKARGGILPKRTTEQFREVSRELGALTRRLHADFV